MALKNDKAVEVFSALNLGRIKDSEVEVAEARAAIRQLAKNPNPVNRYEIAQLLAFIVTDIINQRTTYLDMIADVKRTSLGEKAMFKIKKSGIKAYIGAKNGTTTRSRIMNAYTDIETIEVSARPYVNLYELGSGKVNFDDCVQDAADEMEKAMVQNIEATLYAAFSGYTSPNYSSGAGVVAATIDPMIRAMQRFGGNVNIVGDINCIYKVADLTGFTTTTDTKQFSDDIINEYNNNGFIGKYKGANVLKLNNPFVRTSLTSTVLKQDLLYLLPAGAAELPLKLVLEGDVESMDRTNIDDNTMEIQLRKYFGSAVVFGDYAQMAVYEDTSL
ncbi:MAG: hypothetical protein ACM3O3_12830 [Syntrophothermus sp.]